MAESVVLACPQCGANNRAPKEKLLQAHCGRCHAALLPAAPIIATEQTFAAQVERSPLPVLVDFWAAWCGPCQMLAPVLDALAAELRGRLKVVKVDVDAQPQLAARFGVRSVPTLFVWKNGAIVDQFVGAMPKQALLARLQPHLAG